MKANDLSGPPQRQDLLEEYRILHARWDAFDSRILTIKGFACGAFGVLSVAALNLNSEIERSWAAGALIIVMLALWHMDWMQRGWQRGNHYRMLNIEEAIAGLKPLDLPHGVQIWRAWHENYTSNEARADRSRIWKTSDIYMPYLPLAAAAAAYYLWLVHT